MKNAMMAPSKVAKPAKPHQAKGKKSAAKPHDVIPKDMAKDRNFTSKGEPKLNATSMPKGEGAMGQRR